MSTAIVRSLSVWFAIVAALGLGAIALIVRTRQDSRGPPEWRGRVVNERGNPIAGVVVRPIMGNRSGRGFECGMEPTSGGTPYPSRHAAITDSHGRFRVAEPDHVCKRIVAVHLVRGAGFRDVGRPLLGPLVLPSLLAYGTYVQELTWEGNHVVGTSARVRGTLLRDGLPIAGAVTSYGSVALGWISPAPHGTLPAPDASRAFDDGAFDIGLPHWGRVEIRAYSGGRSATIAVDVERGEVLDGLAIELECPPLFDTLWRLERTRMLAPECLPRRPR